MNTPKEFQTPALNRIWSDCIQPHLNGQYLTVAADLVELIDREGPLAASTVDSENPEEPDAWLMPHAFRLLKQVSLAEHIATVVEEASQLITPRQLLLYRLVILAVLGSDISKVPVVPSVYDNHSFDSWIFVEKIIKNRLSAPEYDEVIKAIRCHHVDVLNGGPICSALRRAHMNARISELSGLNVDLNLLAREWRKIPSLPLQFEMSLGLLPLDSGPVPVTKLDCGEIDLRWLDIGRFIEALSEIVDRCRPDDFAISRRRGRVYFAPHTFYRAFRMLALNNGWRTVLLYDGDPFERQRLLKSLVRKLYDAGAILGNYPEVGMYYLVHFVWAGKGDYVHMPLISFHQSVFPKNILARDRFRPGWLARVKRIWPVGEFGMSRVDFLREDALPEDEW